MKIVHVINCLETAGAQKMLFNLLPYLEQAGYENMVVSLMPEDAVAEEIRRLGVPVRVLGLSRANPNVFLAERLARWIREWQADIVQTWLYHSDLLGSYAALRAGCRRIVWTVHNGNLQRSRHLWLARVCGLLSHRVPRCIISCSAYASRVHAALGYAEERMRLIPNGFDMDVFQPLPEAYAAARATLDVPPEAVLMGMVARYDAQKGHTEFVEAACRLAALRDDVYFAMIGRGVTWENPKLADIIRQAGYEDRFRLLGEQDDMPHYYNLMDVAVSSSLGEAFSLAVGEAMACGIPCVVTDVGDSAAMVGESGVVVPPGNIEALSAAMRGLVEAGAARREELGQAARQRIEARYSLQSVAQQYVGVYEQLDERLNPPGSQIRLAW